MVDSTAIKDYLKKLQKVINFEAVFTLGNYKLVKKTRIDDIMCCVLATLPDSYKKMLKTKKDIQRYNSVLCYGALTKLLAKRFFLDKKLSMVDVTEANKMISSIIISIERDLNAIDQLYNE